MVGTIAEAVAMLFLAVSPALGAEAHLNISVSGSVYQPWVGDRGHSAILSAQYALHDDQFWIGIEVEYRAFDADLGDGFRPDYTSILFRGLFHYHPFPEATLSPYVGLGTGVGLNIVDGKDNVNGERRRIRRSVSAGTTFLGLVGVQTRIPGTRHLSLFAETRFESASDFWKKRGGNWQFDQVGGVTGTVGLRARF